MSDGNTPYRKRPTAGERFRGWLGRGAKRTAKWAGRKTWQATKWTGRQAWKGTRKAARAAFPYTARKIDEVRTVGVREAFKRQPKPTTSIYTGEREPPRDHQPPRRLEYQPRQTVDQFFNQPSPVRPRTNDRSRGPKP